MIEWAKGTFTTYRKEMKGVDWGALHREFKDKVYDAAALEKEVAKLMMDDDVTKKPGIYPYVLTGVEKHLTIRAFTDNQKREAYERQKGVCPVCKKKFEIGEMEADHIKPWHEGGKTNAENCKMLCRACNRTKGREMNELLSRIPPMRLRLGLKWNEHLQRLAVVFRYSS